MPRPISTCTLLMAAMFSVTPCKSTPRTLSPLEETRGLRDAIMPMSLSRVARSLTNSYSSGRSCGLRFCISMNFLGSQGPNHAMRTTRKPSEPMLETFSAIYRFMPWISAVTAISVVVARMMPSSVRKLRSLFLRSESSAIRVASQNDAERRNERVSNTVLVEEDGIGGGVVPGKERYAAISVRGADLLQRHHHVLEQQVDRFQAARLALVREVEKTAHRAFLLTPGQRGADQRFLGPLALLRFASAGHAGIECARRAGQAAAVRRSRHRNPALRMAQADIHPAHALSSAAIIKTRVWASFNQLAMRSPY